VRERAPSSRPTSSARVASGRSSASIASSAWTAVVGSLIVGDSARSVVLDGSLQQRRHVEHLQHRGAPRQSTPPASVDASWMNACHTIGASRNRFRRGENVVVPNWTTRNSSE
jgi:hypothetical protein